MRRCQRERSARAERVQHRYGRVLRTKYGYVVQDDNYKRNVKLFKSYFEQIGLPLCGRVAEFEYINMDVCIDRARKLAQTLSAPRSVSAERLEEQPV